MSLTKSTILVVDDEPINTVIITEYLAEEGYDFRTATDGAAAWEMLEQAPEEFDVVLLDRMMPRMDGMEVLRRIKADPRLEALPVILQTARVAREDVIEGIRAGAYYYLTKPFEEDMLRSVVRTAVRDILQYRKLQAELAQSARTLGLMSQGRFRLRTLDEAQALAAMIANACPEPRRVVMGLSELLVNALEHGNLGITYAEKSELNATGAWRMEVERRTALAENRGKFVELEFERTPSAIHILIMDQGEGFDWEKYLSFSPERSMDNHGRGIAMAGLLSFDRIEYQGQGNRVLAVIRAPQGGQQEE